MKVKVIVSQKAYRSGTYILDVEDEDEDDAINAASVLAEDIPLNDPRIDWGDFIPSGTLWPDIDDVSVTLDLEA